MCVLLIAAYETRTLLGGVHRIKWKVGKLGTISEPDTGYSYVIKSSATVDVNYAVIAELNGDCFAATWLRKPS